MDVVDRMEVEGPNKGNGEENVRKAFVGIRTRVWRKFKPLFTSIQLKEMHVILLHFWDIPLTKIRHDTRIHQLNPGLDCRDHGSHQIQDLNPPGYLMQLFHMASIAADKQVRNKLKV